VRVILTSIGFETERYEPSTEIENADSLDKMSETVDFCIFHKLSQWVIVILKLVC